MVQGELAALRQLADRAAESAHGALAVQDKIKPWTDRRSSIPRRANPLMRLAMRFPTDDAVLPDVIPLQVDAETLTRFRRFCEQIGRSDEVARVAAEVFQDLVRDDEFGAANGRLNS